MARLGPIALVWLVATPLPVGAAETGVLTMEEALHLALARHEVPMAAAARVEQAEATVDRAWSRVRPDLRFDAAYTRRPNRVTRDVGGNTAIIQQDNALGLTGQLSTTVVDAPAIPVILEARRTREAVSLESKDAVRQFSFEVALAFLEAVTTERIYAAALRRVEVAEAALGLADRRLDLGLGTQNEVTRTALALSTARLSANNAKVEVIARRLRLENHLLVDVARPLDDSLLDDAALGRGELERALPEAAPHLLALDARRRAAVASSWEPWLRLVPSLDVGAQFRLTNEPGLQGRVANWSLSATASWIVYEGGLRSAESRQRRAFARELALELSLRTREQARDVAEANARIVAAEAALDEATRAAELAEENAEQVEKLFEAGLAGALSFADATAAAFEADVGRARQIQALRVALLERRRALGQWPLDGLEPRKSED